MSKATGPLYAVHFKRRRLGKTDYAKRLALLKSGQPRLVVRKTNRGLICHVVEYSEQGDRTTALTTSRELFKHGWTPKRNTPTAYLTGMLCGLKAKKAGIKNVVLDIGLHPSTKGGIVFACLKGAVDAGIEAKYGEEQMPPESRINGSHLKKEKEFADAKAALLKV
ncbi:50S ribosomal protein L18 [Candidatus Micrarchaeota archaeon CG_4_10_14_0_2_um_filter_60_11]|nr:MAG: hypothetical protein AUJ16_01940 [Candidatus Micrarchaeota archaeon CG1_02_60_51]PIN96509.1 MAG: 50S ribosomal protein L18 [Candidatus Micrarchaeota archaeon CG10_big_fil_rev_8_21_14_0_10_60_32]PIO01881.1 MAG: 50S ribosomal protein L18 [Candidatus Micrarchaeota archaeon CG09_land_8_20_14_0_10_60_16]PIY91560.1 MAG: 50S ribosomal protein L18 [Candidatus Micrarchaeota archaeon CG_4_10_14_0_8_um_filter_60_7]PIZ90837.1 MAG: 50S ribosomal protein L18 [Candidatus Micrarchaeota archaeon CG_4_10